MNSNSIPDDVLIEIANVSFRHFKHAPPFKTECAKGCPMRQCTVAVDAQQKVVVKVSGLASSSSSFSFHTKNKDVAELNAGSDGFLYICGAHGHVHECGQGKCKMGYSTRENMVCLLTGMYLGVEFAQDWRAGFKSCVSSVNDNWADVDSSLPRKLNSAGRCMFDTSTFRVTSSRLPYTFAYGQIVARFKGILCHFLFSDERRAVEDEGRAVTDRHIHKELARYTHQCKASGRQINMQAVMALFSFYTISRASVTLFVPEIDDMDRLLEVYAQRGVRLLLIAATMCGTNEPQILPDHVFLAMLSLCMSPHGLVLDGRTVLPPCGYLRMQMPNIGKMSRSPQTLTVAISALKTRLLACTCPDMVFPVSIDTQRDKAAWTAFVTPLRANKKTMTLEEEAYIDHIVSKRRRTEVREEAEFDFDD